MIESCLTWVGHITHMSCLTQEWVTLHIWMSHVSCMNESCLTYPFQITGWAPQLPPQGKVRGNGPQIRRKSAAAQVFVYYRFAIPKMCSKRSRWHICRKGAATEVCSYVQFDGTNVVMKKKMTVNTREKCGLGFVCMCGFVCGMCWCNLESKSIHTKWEMDHKYAGKMRVGFCNIVWTRVWNVLI